MSRLTLAILPAVALFVGVLLGAQCATRPPAPCLPITQAVNALYEQDMRSEIHLSPKAISILHDIEALACEPETE
jgi:hypothetical protein